MINHISEIKIYSALNNLLEHPNKNLARKHDFILRIMIKELKKNFNEWFTLIENNPLVKVSLNNDKKI
jgi:hypothetical protein